MKKGAHPLLSFPAILAYVILFLLICTSLFAPLIAPYDPLEINMSDRLATISAQHLLGTDSLGRDVLSRLLYGGQTAIFLALISTLFTMTIGIGLGTISGYFGGFIDDVIYFCVNLFQGLPGLSLMIAIAGVLGPGMESILIAVVLTSWADFSRLVRGEALKIREEGYIEGIRVLGSGHLYTLWHYVLPNMLGPLLVLLTVRTGRVMLAIAALSFLGLGLQPPWPDWGVMVNDARPYINSNVHLMVAPGLCIIAFSLAMNLLGDALRDYMDVRTDHAKKYL